MLIPVFLSYSKPFNNKQKIFIEHVKQYINDRGFQVRTLGVTDYDMKNPLTAIRRLMIESNGMLTIAFRRSEIKEGTSMPNPDIPNITSRKLDGMWLTSPYCHIEPAMAFQIGLPILIFRENGVIADGILENGITGTYLPEFELLEEKDIEKFFHQEEWKQLIGQWEGYVRRVSESKGYPPKLY